MIDLYTGTPGSGKSLHMAKVIKEQIQKGRPCIGNFAINYDMIKPHPITHKKGDYIRYDIDDLTPDILIDLAYDVFDKLGKIKQDYILLFIDEAQLYFNTREWNRKDRMWWIKFFSLHRHYGYKIILVAQNDKMLDKQIRTAVVEHETIHRKALSFGLFGFLLNLLCLGGLHVALENQYGTKQRLHTTFFKCKKSLYKLYDTFALFDGAMERKGQGSLGRTCTEQTKTESNGESLLDNTNT